MVQKSESPEQNHLHNVRIYRSDKEAVWEEASMRQALLDFFRYFRRASCSSYWDTLIIFIMLIFVFFQFIQDAKAVLLLVA